MESNDFRSLCEREYNKYFRISICTFLAKGSFEKKPKPQWLPVRFAQVINLFHLPTKVNFVKGLEYTVYRKLPYPTAIPTPENTPAKELTVL